MDCIFCKLANGEIPTATLYEDDEFRVILDQGPATKGHALILPKSHAANIYELSDEMAAKAMILAKHMAARLREGLNCDGFNIVQNNGEIAGQTVFHFHMHLIPRYEGDNVGITWKPGKLTDEEYEVIKGHVEASIDIIRHLPSLDYVIPAVIGHHERYDGKGYPRRIAGEDIPLTARILCVADSFDAMTSKRCYKELMPVEKALQIIREEEGKQFDPDMAEVFIHIFREGKIHLAEPAEIGRAHV